MKEFFDSDKTLLMRLSASFSVLLAGFGARSVAQTLPVQRPPQVNAGKTSEARLSTDTVIMFRLTKLLTSRNAKVGDTFEAKLDTEAEGPYQGLPEHTMLEGHISFVSAKNIDTPGVLGLGFDRVRMTNGSRYLIKGVVIPISDRNMSKIGKRWVSKSAGASRYYKFVGFGPAGGTLVSITPNGQLLPTNIMNGTLGFMYRDITQDPTKSRDITLVEGTKLGVRLYRELVVRVPWIQ